MTNIKISDLPELLNSTNPQGGINNNDLLLIVDTSETNVSLKTKKIKVENLHENLATTAYVQSELATINLNDLSDVNLTTNPTNNQTLIYNAATSQFIPGTISSAGAVTFDSLTDVNIGTPTILNNKQLIGWNNTLGQFTFIQKAGTAIGDLVELINISGNPALPAVDGSQLLNLPTGASSPLTTKGDLNTYSTLNTRLSVGTNNQILMADSVEATGLKWKSLSSTDLNLTTTSTQTTVNFKVTGGKTELGPLHIETNLNALNGEFLQYNTSNTRFESVDPTGTSIGNIVKLGDVGGNAALPAVDGSLLTNLPNSSPLTTKGDIYVRNTTSNTRLPVGTNNYVLTADSSTSTGVDWKPISVASNPFTSERLSITTPYTLTNANAKYIYITTNNTVNQIILPVSPSLNDFFYIVLSNEVTLNSQLELKETASVLIDTLTLTTKRTAQCHYDGIEWQIIIN